MSYSSVHILDPNAIKEANAVLRTIHRSKDAFDELIVATWSGEVKYSHKQFVADCGRKRAKDWTVHFLAQHLLNGMPHEKVSVDYSLQLALAEGEYLPDPDLGDDEGFEIDDPPVRAFLGLPYGKRPRKGLLSEQLLMEHQLLLKLSARRPLPKPPDTKYPIWAIAPTDYYQGYLTVREMKAVAPDRSGGYFDVAQRALKYSSDPVPMTRVLEQLRSVRERLLAAGTGSLCVSVEV
jgi:hypothetical protein